MKRGVLAWRGGCALLVVALAGCGSPQHVPPTVSEIHIGDSDAVRRAPTADAPVNRPRFHEVQAGETLTRIALRYGLSYTDLALWNNLPNPDLIEPGQRLQLHPPGEQPEISTVQATPRQELVPTGADGKPKVTRTQVSAGSNRVTVAGLVDEPRALKINYTKSAHDRLLSSASGGATRAALPANRTGAPAPANRKVTNGIAWSWPADGRLLASFSDTNRGIDIGGARGQPIFASADGNVIYAGTGLKGYGQIVIIKHANEYLSTYAHNDRILVAEGEKVKRGDRVAEMGDSGADRVGLHFSIRRGEETFDPRAFLPATP